MDGPLSDFDPPVARNIVIQIVVSELHRHGRAMAPATIAQSLDLATDEVAAILANLEAKKGFLSNVTVGRRGVPCASPRGPAVSELALGCLDGSVEGCRHGIAQSGDVGVVGIPLRVDFRDHDHREVGSSAEPAQDGGGRLETEHRFYLGGTVFMTLHYEIEPK
jgi:hypothetical protein